MLGTPTDKWNEILQKARSGIDKLATDERIIYWVNRCLYEVENGGVSGFVYNNESPTFEDLLTIADCLDRIGAGATATAVRNVRELVNKPAPEAKTWGEFLRAVDPNGDLEKRAAPLHDLSGAWDLLEKFTRERYPNG